MRVSRTRSALAKKPLATVKSLPLKALLSTGNLP